LVLVLTTETLPAFWFETKTRSPRGVRATAIAPPSGLSNFATVEFVAVSKTNKPPILPAAAMYANSDGPVSTIVMPRGSVKMPSGIGKPTTASITVSMIVIELSVEFVT
jgi:hypothetical protein